MPVTPLLFVVPKRKEKSVVIISELKNEPYSQDFSRADLLDLADTLVGCVSLGASVGFIFPFGQAEALTFWHKLLPAFAAGERRILVARLNDKIIGTVQLVVDMPGNGQHRADVVTLLVHPDKTLLVLDTVTDSDAQSLYHSLGYALCGVIPGYALSTEGVFDSTSVMYKKIGS
jgi:hypothetical protein